MKLQYDWGQGMVVVYGLQVPVKAADVILSCDIPAVLDTIRWYRKYSQNTTNKLV